jgi:TonB family protein
VAYLGLVRPQMKQPQLLYIFLCLSVPLAALAGSLKTSKGITADDRVVIAPYRTSPPWAADIIKEVRPHLSASERAKHHSGEGLFRVILDLGTGTVRRVVVMKSSGYPGIDQSVIDALRQWRLRPRKWKEFEIHVGLWQ